MIRALTILLTITMVTPVAAQDMSESECQRLWSVVVPLGIAMSLPEIEPKTIRSADGWCIADEVEFKQQLTPHMETSIETIRWRGKALEQSLANGQFPSAIEIELDNLRNIPQPGDIALDYVFRAQSRRSGIDGRFAATWDQATGVFRLEHLEFRFPGGDGVLISAEAENIDLALPDGPANTAAYGVLNDISIALHNEEGALFENLALLPLASALLTGTQPAETQVAALRSQASEIIYALPENAFPAETRAALVELIDDMPNPNGTLAISIVFDPGFGLEAAQKHGETIVKSGIPAIWPGVTVTARYDHKNIPR